MIFSWDDWNIGHIAEHGVTSAEAEFVVRRASNPFPYEIEDEKMVVWGQTEHGRYLQVIFAFREADAVEFGSVSLEELAALLEGEETEVIYVVHAMPLSRKMLRQYRRMRR